NQPGTTIDIMPSHNADLQQAKGAGTLRVPSASQVERANQHGDWGAQPNLQRACSLTTKRSAGATHAAATARQPHRSGAGSAREARRKASAAPRAKSGRTTRAPAKRAVAAWLGNKPIPGAPAPADCMLLIPGRHPTRCPAWECAA